MFGRKTYLAVVLLVVGLLGGCKGKEVDPDVKRFAGRSLTLDLKDTKLGVASRGGSLDANDLTTSDGAYQEDWRIRLEPGTPFTFLATITGGDASTGQPSPALQLQILDGDKVVQDDSVNVQNKARLLYENAKGSGVKILRVRTKGPGAAKVSYVLTWKRGSHPDMN